MLLPMRQEVGRYIYYVQGKMAHAAQNIMVLNLSSGYCLQRLRTTITLWSFIRSNVIDQAWKSSPIYSPPPLHPPHSPSLNGDSPSTPSKKRSLLQSLPSSIPTPNSKPFNVKLGGIWGALRRQGSMGNVEDAKKEENERLSLKEAINAGPPSPSLTFTTTTTTTSPRSPGSAAHMVQPPPLHPTRRSLIAVPQSPISSSHSSHPTSPVDSSSLAPPPPPPNRTRGRSGTVSAPPPPSTIVAEVVIAKRILGIEEVEEVEEKQVIIVEKEKEIDDLVDAEELPEKLKEAEKEATDVIPASVVANNVSKEEVHEIVVGKVDGDNPEKVDEVKESEGTEEKKTDADDQAEETPAVSKPAVEETPEPQAPIVTVSNADTEADPSEKTVEVKDTKLDETSTDPPKDTPTIHDLKTGHSSRPSSPSATAASAPPIPRRAARRAAPRPPSIAGAPLGVKSLEGKKVRSRPVSVVVDGRKSGEVVRKSSEVVRKSVEIKRERVEVERVVEEKEEKQTDEKEVAKVDDEEKAGEEKELHVPLKKEPKEVEVSKVGDDNVGEAPTQSAIEVVEKVEQKIEEVVSPPELETTQRIVEEQSTSKNDDEPEDPVEEKKGDETPLVEDAVSKESTKLAMEDSDPKSPEPSNPDNSLAHSGALIDSPTTNGFIAKEHSPPPPPPLPSKPRPKLTTTTSTLSAVSDKSITSTPGAEAIESSEESWEQKTYNEIVRLRLEMFWARIGASN